MHPLQFDKTTRFQNQINKTNNDIVSNKCTKMLDLFALFFEMDCDQNSWNHQQDLKLLVISIKVWRFKNLQQAGIGEVNPIFYFSL